LWQFIEIGVITPLVAKIAGLNASDALWAPIFLVQASVPLG
jgi:hypothetical protein